MKHSVILLAVLLAAPCFAEDFFNVNFNDVEVDKAPPAQAYRRGEAANHVTRIVDAEGSSARVVEKAGELADKPLLFNPGRSDSNAQIILDGGNNLATSGVVKLEFDVEPVSYKPSEQAGHETVFAIMLIGNSGVTVGYISYGINTQTSSGVINFFGAQNKRAELGDFAPGKAAKFEIELDLTEGVANIKVNGELKAEKMSIPTEHAFRLLQFRSGRALGGRDGALTVALDNIRIYQ